MVTVHHVTKITEEERDVTGRIVGGLVEFEDGKIWRFNCKTRDNIFFIINSGWAGSVTGQEFTRRMKGKSRVTALVKKLRDMEEWR